MTRKDLFAKRGRPTYEEKEIVTKILDFIDEDPVKEKLARSYGKAADKQELYELLSVLKGDIELPASKFSKTHQETKKINTETPQQIAPDPDDKPPTPTQQTPQFTGQPQLEGVLGDPTWLEKQAQQHMSGGNDHDKYDPFNAPVAEKDYVGNKGIESSEGEQINPDPDQQGTLEAIKEDEFPENDHKKSLDGTEGADALQEDDIPEPGYIQAGASQSQGLDTSNIGDELEEGEDHKWGEEGEKRDISETQKKKYAKQSADALLKLYEKGIPAPFKYLTKISDSEFKRMIYEDRLDPEMLINEEGVTVRDYIAQLNKQIDQMHAMSDEVKEEIREPLIEVLMEEEFYLTPKQRLGIAIASDMFSRMTATISLKKDIAITLENFQAMHSATKPPKPESETPDESTPKTFESVETDDPNLMEEVENIMDEANQSGVQVVDENNQPISFKED